MPSETRFPGLARDGDQEAGAHVHALLTELPDVMLTTFERAGDSPIARAQPMHVAQLDPDSTMWFMTALHTQAVAQARTYPEATVVGQSRRCYVSLAGPLEIVTARERVRAIWTRAHEIWFPAGPDDPDVGLLRFTPREAEFWDVSNMQGIRFLYAAAKALLKGTRPEQDPAQHGAIQLRH